MTPPAVGPRAVGRHLLPAAWAGLAVAAAVLASVLSGALTGSTLPVVVGTSVTRSGMDVVGVACVGLTLLGTLLPQARALPGAAVRDLSRVRSAADRWLVPLAGIWLVLVILGIMFRVASAFGRPVSQLNSAELVEWSTDLAAGRGMLLTVGCAAAVLVCGVIRLYDPDRIEVRIPMVAALLGMITPSVTGHAGSAPDHQLAIITVGAHVGAAALWVGGLAAVLVLVARHRALLEVVLPRFSRLATGCLIAITLTGGVTALIRLQSWDALVTTGYGWLVLAKTACLVMLACLGGLARRRLAAGRTPVLRWAGFETALMAATLGIAAALSQSA
jgi:putative copper resistance protein D